MMFSKEGVAWCCLICITTIITRIRADNGVNRTEMMFPRCNSTVSCASFCTSVNILDAFNATLSRSLQDANNVLCIDTTRPMDIYQLTGCPREGYLATEHSTDGICYMDTENGWDLYLTPSKMTPGLHSFTCWINSNSGKTPIFLYSYAIALNDTGASSDMVLFSDIQAYVNDEPVPKETANINMVEGEELKIVARVVPTSDGIIINATTTSPAYGVNATERFTASTRFLCNKNDNKFSGLGRYQLYALNATLSDNRTTVTVFIELTGTATRIAVGEFNITVNVNPSKPPTKTSSTPGPTSLPSEEAGPGDDSSTTITVAVVIPLLLIILIIVIIVVLILYLRRKHEDPQTTAQFGSESADGNDSKKTLGGGYMQQNEQLKVLVYSCDHHPTAQLLSGLKEKNFTMIEELEKTTDPSFQLTDHISKLTFELNQGAALLDCSCPKDVRNDLYKAVEYFTQKPFASLKSQDWKVFQLVYVDNGAQMPSSWSKPLDHVSMMYYTDFDDSVVDKVVAKLEECVPSRSTSSIVSGSENNRLLTKIDVTVEKLEEKLGEMAKGQQKVLDKVDDVRENVGVIQEGQAGIMLDIRRKNEES